MKREKRLNVDFYEFAAGRGRHLQGALHTHSSSSSNQASRMCLEGLEGGERGGGGSEEKEEAGKRGWIPSLGRGWAMGIFQAARGGGSDRTLLWIRRGVGRGAAGVVEVPFYSMRPFSTGRRSATNGPEGRGAAPIEYGAQTGSQVVASLVLARSSIFAIFNALAARRAQDGPLLLSR